MLAMALLSLSLAAGSAAAPSSANDAVDLDHAHSAPKATTPGETPPGVVAPSTMDEIQLDQQHTGAGSTARETGAHNHPKRACSNTEVRTGHCDLRPSGQTSTRSGDGSSDENDSAPSTTSP